MSREKLEGLVESLAHEGISLANAILAEDWARTYPNPPGDAALDAYNRRVSRIRDTEDRIMTALEEVA